MAKLSADATLFGLDLSSAWMHLRQIGRGLPLFQWLAQAIPATPVALLQANPDLDAARTAQQVRLRADQWLGPLPSSSKPADNRPARFHALLLPEDAILMRTLRLPVLGPEDLAAAIELEVLALSPFAAQDTVSAYQAQPEPSNRQLQVQLILASRATIEQHQQRAVDAHGLSQPPEVWAPVGSGKAILCPGWGEQPRLRHEQRQRWSLWASVLVLLLVLAALVVTPSLQLRQRVLQAQQQTQALVDQTKDIAAQREALMRQVQTLSALPTELLQEADFLKVLEALTRALPDDTALQSLALEGNRLRAQGLSDNASRVQELLGKEPGFENVRLPSAITREGRSNKESFVLEAELNPAIFTLWQLPQNTAQPAAAP